MRRKIISIILTSILSISLISCGSKRDTENLSSAYQNLDFSEEPVTITYLTIGDKPTNGATEEVVEELNKLLLKKANAKLEVCYISWNEYLAYYNSTVANADGNIDLIGIGDDWLDAWQNVMDDNFYPLSEGILKTYCPQTYAQVSEENWDKCKYNGIIYMIPEDNYEQWTNHGFMYRGDWAEAAGLDSVDSFEDLTQYFEYVISAHPDVIPWDASGTEYTTATGYLQSKSYFIPISGLSTYSIWGSYKNDIKTISCPIYDSDLFIEYAQLMKKWNDMGVWRASVLNNSSNNTNELYTGDTSVIEQHTNKFYSEVKPQMNISHPESDLQFYWYGEENNNLVKISILHGGMAVSKTSKNPERALMVYDLIRNDRDCYNLMNYGIEGRQYVISEEGYRERPADYNIADDSITLNYWWGRNDNLEIRDANACWDDYEELTSVYDKVAIEYPWGNAVITDETLIDKMSIINEICSVYIPNICFGQYDQEPDEYVREFRNELKKADIENVTKEIQNLVDEN